MMKVRLKGAQKGHSLLKKKSDALTARFRAILKEIVRVDLHCLCCRIDCKCTIGIWQNSERRSQIPQRDPVYIRHLQI